MTTLTYKQQLLHPNWQRRRLEILSRDEFTCQGCYDKESTLHVHHKRYVKGRMAWEYPDAELVTLCWPCHELQHEESDAFKELVAALPLDEISDAKALLAGWANGERGSDFTAHFNDNPFTYMVGEIARRVAGPCTADQLMELGAALQKRDRHTVRAAVHDFIADLTTRQDAEPPPFDPADAL